MLGRILFFESHLLWRMHRILEVLHFSELPYAVCQCLLQCSSLKFDDTNSYATSANITWYRVDWFVISRSFPFVVWA